MRAGRRAIRQGLRSRRARLTRARPLVKDPLALLSAEWLAHRFDTQNLVMIRHPAAFVSSVMKIWRHSFERFLADEQLLHDHLARFEKEIRAEVKRPSDMLSPAALMWRILYSGVATFRERQPTWLFLRHEDVSLEPMPVFREVYEGPFVDRAFEAHDVGGADPAGGEANRAKPLSQSASGSR
jgi:hypothetical protein